MRLLRPLDEEHTAHPFLGGRHATGARDGLCLAVPLADTRLSPQRGKQRLFYVALTRCKEVLVVSSVYRLERRLAFKIGLTPPKGGGQFFSPLASTFLNELGQAAPDSVRGDEFLRTIRGITPT